MPKWAYKFVRGKDVPALAPGGGGSAMEQFRIVLSGKLIQGVDAATARKQLAKLLGKDEAFAAQFIAGHSRTVKRGVDAATAVRYVTALRAIGVECRFEPDTLDFDDAEVGAVARAATFGAAPSASAATAPKSAPLPEAIPVRKGDTGALSSTKRPYHVSRGQVLFTLFVLCPALIWFMSSSSAPEKSAAQPASNLPNSTATQSVVQRQPIDSPKGARNVAQESMSGSPTSKDVMARPGEIEAIQVYVRKLYAHADSINLSYKRCQSAAKKSLSRFDAVGASRAFAVHGVIMLEQLDALNRLAPPSVTDETARKYIQSAKEGLIEDASAQQKQVAVMTRTPQHEEDIAEVARYTTLSNMGTAKFVISVMRTYERYGYAMEDVDIDTHVLKRGAQSKSRATESSAR